MREVHIRFLTLELMSENRALGKVTSDTASDRDATVRTIGTSVVAHPDRNRSRQLNQTGEIFPQVGPHASYSITKYLYMALSSYNDSICKSRQSIASMSNTIMQIYCHPLT